MIPNRINASKKIQPPWSNIPTFFEDKILASSLLCQELMFEDNHDIEVNGLWDTNTKRGLQVFLHQQAGGNDGGDLEAFLVGKMHGKS